MPSVLIVSIGCKQRLTTVPAKAPTKACLFMSNASHILSCTTNWWFWKCVLSWSLVATTPFISLAFLIGLKEKLGPTAFSLDENSCLNMTLLSVVMLWGISGEISFSMVLLLKSGLLTCQSNWERISIVFVHWYFSDRLSQNHWHLHLYWWKNSWYQMKQEIALFEMHWDFQSVGLLFSFLY